MLNSRDVDAFTRALPTLPPQPDGVPWPADDWPSAAAGTGVDATRLTALLDQAFPNEAIPNEAFPNDVSSDPQPENSLGLSLACVVVHRGHVIAERYGPDTDADTTLTSWSMAKSITHAAVGMLVAEGRLDLDAPAPVPEWSNPSDPRHAITLRQLLHMSSGLEFNEVYVDGDMSHCLEMLFGDGHTDMGAYAAGQQLLHEPGTVLNYNSGTSNIVSRIIAGVVGTGADYEAWLRDRLFAPLGMSSAQPKFDEVGTFVGSSYLDATARDFARFGTLYLRDGVWDDQRLLPPGWVDLARTPVAFDDEGSHYGSHWWIPNPERGVFAAQGYETQRIIVVPDADAVVVRLGKTDISLAPNVIDWLNQIIDCLTANSATTGAANGGTEETAQ